MSVQIVIKSPNQQNEDVKVDCELSWSVNRLKEHLTSVYPTKPAKWQQKIIFAGRLLPDHLLLKDILAQEQGVCTMHLVCPYSTNTSKENASEVVEEIKEVNSAPYPSTNFIPHAVPANELRPRLLEQTTEQPSGSNLYPQVQMPTLASYTPVNSPYMAYQMALFQQTYAQAIAQYQAQGQTMPTNNAPSFLPNQAPPAHPVHNAETVRQNENRHVPPMQQNANNDEAEEHDFLDSLYMLTRVLMISMLLYFYSSIRRVLLVFFAGIILFTYLNSRRRSQQQSESVARQQSEAVARENSRQEDTQIGADVSQNNPSEQRPEGAEDVLSPDRNTSPQSTSLQSRVPSIFTAGCAFVKMFFTSLIPEQPLPIEGN